MKSTLTIGMPVFNDIDFIEQSIKSILNLKDVDFILIISDDGSTDGSAEICLKYAEEDKRIKYIRQQRNLGISKNMEFLLGLADTPYFMWAADDDLWDPYFASILIQLLQNNPKAIAAFSIYNEINETNEQTNEIVDINYSNNNRYKRLVYFIKNANDGLGYGIFKTNKIKHVTFPVWWWPNHKTPYNNIYPTLCYYLTLGDYSFYNERALFYKRVKTIQNTNHYTTGKGNGIFELSSFVIRRFNLITYSSKLIKSKSSFLFMVKIYPNLFYHWFLKESIFEIKKALINKIKK
ncbi:MAG: glycosyltransferase family 2 protein [Fluviicola sp.]|nr:glycosyltransferase family 2 protein [Fluviicola sp.]